MSVLISLCDGCRHRTVGQRCQAFPQGIPTDYLLGQAYHTEPVAGDNGLVFTPIDAVWKATAAEVLAEFAKGEPVGEGELMP